MPGKFKTKLRVLNLLLSILILAAFHSKIVKNPGGYLFNLDADGIRTYFVIQYYAKDRSSENFHFRGMNYPFGENINYMDGLPVYSVFLRWLNSAGFQTEKIAVAFLNLAMFLSIPLASMILLELLFYYAAPSLLTVVFASGCAFISPQIHRIYNHFGLAFLFVLPGVWLLFLRKNHTGHRVFYTASILCLTVFFSFVHFYYAFLAAAMLFALIWMDRRTGLQRRIFQTAALCILPLVVVRLLVFLSSGADVADRIDRPYGAFGVNYFSSIGDILLPNSDSYFWKLISYHPSRRGTWEGESYIGPVVLAAGVLFTILFITRRKRISQVLSRLRKNGAGSIFDYFQAGRYAGLKNFALVFFLFSSGIVFMPFSDSMLDHFPAILKQFRSLGRLSWIIYLFLTVYIFRRLSAYSRLLQIRSGKIAANALLAAAALLYGLEILEVNLRLRHQTQSDAKRIELLDRSARTLAGRIDPSRYQAAVGLPYFNTGADISELVRQPDGEILFLLTGLSLNTGLPLTNMMGSRSSQSMARMQYSWYNGKDRSVCRFYRSRKKFLILTTDSAIRKIREKKTEKAEELPAEITVINEAKLLSREGGTVLLELDYNQICR